LLQVLPNFLQYSALIINSLTGDSVEKTLNFDKNFLLKKGFFQVHLSENKLITKLYYALLSTIYCSNFFHGA